MSSEILPVSRLRHLSGFGFASGGDAYVYRPTRAEEILEVFALAEQTGRQISLRGAGRSYGDANYGSETITLDLTRMNRILSWDPQSGIVEAEAGASIEDLWRHCLEDGWWPPVVTGTMYPTLGGALGMNVHGKNNYVQGTIGEHVLEIECLFPNGARHLIKPDNPLFSAVISSAGLLGVITRVKLQMHKVSSGNLRVWAQSARSWEEQFALFEKYEHDSDYMVSWIDCFGKSAGAGRGLFHAAWYEDAPNPQSLRADEQDLPPLILGFFPKAVVWKILKAFCNRPGMRLINWARYFSGSTIGNHKMHPQSLVAFSFLLDYVPDWRKSYLPGGFIQYQSFVPKEHAHRVFAAQVQLQQQAKLESFLGVLKRHRPDGFLFSHGVDGYSLALDFRVTDRNQEPLVRLAHQMNDLVLEAGGRFYFAKDSTLRPSDLTRYLGEQALGTYQQLKAELDPDNLLTSDLAKRVKLDPS